MTAPERREDVAVAEVLAGHRLHASMNICTGCDWRATAGVGPLADQHEAHVAEALAPLIAECAAEAWDEGYEASTCDVEARSAPPGPNGPVDPTPNPYRADRRAER